MHSHTCTDRVHASPMVADSMRLALNHNYPIANLDDNCRIVYPCHGSYVCIEHFVHSHDGSADWSYKQQYDNIHTVTQRNGRKRRKISVLVSTDRNGLGELKSKNSEIKLKCSGANHVIQVFQFQVFWFLSYTIELNLNSTSSKNDCRMQPLLFHLITNCLHNMNELFKRQFLRVHILRSEHLKLARDQ